ncbi:protein KINESIN LIGHT CHAIN-RELATED 3-like [Mangifera indica]|uniref:protein KINESIN LIGHT CHAIN-RELATED 3-like n=1 Tax=Mangifera indica TaxID=29780 RepID=UPI001CFA4EA6|nr:protein KINESIN LIGHT CHAIN-RELATED 3-like [Mangifera indica]XP_044487106.1 protein KINESIN LIGHT CHAIN-RELATED 3-like [Mangifera indica]XP_044487107.1 protein KINESIN LIGHT CHAIN-RELATED 3-like [Mangifera indica]
MPGIVIDEIHEEEVVNELNRDSMPVKENSVPNKSPENTATQQSPRNVASDVPDILVVDASIEQLYENVCDMQSSDWSPSRPSFVSDGEESRIDSELRHLVGGEIIEVEITEEEELEKPEHDSRCNSSSKIGTSSQVKQLQKLDKTTSSKSNSPEKVEASSKSSPQGISPSNKPPIDKRNDKNLNPGARVTPLKKRRGRLQNGTKAESRIDNPDLGPFLLRQARELISTGANPQKALQLALRAKKLFEICAKGKPSLEMVMCLHVAAAIHCSLGQYDDAISVLEQSVEIPVTEEGQEHALAKFAGHMQLGDTYAMLGQLENSLLCYTTGLEVLKQVLGDTDPRVGETCRYLAEAYVQALQFDEAKRLCQLALDIHKENGSPSSLEEAADRKLMGLICETMGNHEAALEHLVLASVAMVANGQEAEVASVDCSIGDTYLSLSQYDEAVFAYQKALTGLKKTKGENHPAVGSVFVRLADVYNRTGQLRESKSYCENALRIYEKPIPGFLPEEIASGLTDVSAIYESMNDLEQAIKLLDKALKLYNDAPGQQSMIAGIEAQMGVMYYMLGNYSDSYNSFKSAISKLRAGSEKKSAFFGIALNQMGLACVQCYSINEAVELFEEARLVLEQEFGQCHPDTLGVYSNLAGTYDAVGRLDDAINMLEFIVRMREEKLGTANPDVDDEKRRLGELLKEVGRARSRKARSLENLLDANSHINTNDIKVDKDI